MEKYASYRVLRKVNDICYFTHRLFSFSIILITKVTFTKLILFQFLIWNIFKTNLGKPGVLYEGKRQGLKNGKFMEMREKNKLAKQDAKLILKIP